MISRQICSFPSPPWDRACGKYEYSGGHFPMQPSFTMQVDRLVVRGAQTMYALGTLKHHGLSGPPLWEVTRATFIARLTYASQAWWGLLDAQSRDRLEKVLNKAVREGFLPKRHPSFAQICDSADEQMFGDILKNPKHVLHHLLPPVSEAKSRLRTRAHDREMPAANQNTFTRKTFINRMLMLNSYWIMSLFLSLILCVSVLYILCFVLPVRLSHEKIKLYLLTYLGINDKTCKVRTMRANCERWENTRMRRIWGERRIKIWGEI